MNDEQFQFHVEEYKALRAEIIHRLEIITGIERTVVVGSFGIYAWISTQGLGENPLILSVMASWLPVLLALAGANQLAGNSQRLVQIGVYIRRLEEKTACAGLGWEQHLHKKSPIGGVSTEIDISRAHHYKARRYYLYFTIVAAIVLDVAFLWASRVGST